MMKVFLTLGVLEYSLTLCLLTLLLAAVERYICIVKPFTHKKFVTKNRVVCGSLFISAVSAIPAISLLAIANFNTRNLNSRFVVIYSIVFDFLVFLLIVIIIFMLTKSFKVGKDSLKSGISQQKNHLRENISRNSEDALHCAMRKKLRLVVIFSIMMAGFLVSVLPFAIGRLLYDTGMLKKWSSTNQYILISACHIIYKSSSLFNPVFTLTLKDDYKKRIAKCFIKCRYHGPQK